MKRISSILLLISLIISTNIFAQDVQQLPDDPRVKKGVLANGLSYILIKNKDEKGYAHFGIAQKIGTSLEEKRQKGMFKMLEALTVKGTRNFTDSTITQYLKSIGLTSEDIVFSTEEDNITYLIKDVPVSKGNSVDSSLLILYNWLGSINIDEEDIREEIPFVKNRLLYDWDAEKRLDDKLLNGLYPQSHYAMNLQPGDIAQVDQFTSKDLRNFYYKWFRPDFQAVVVAGDIDLNVMATKVESIFSTIPKPLDKQERDYFEPEPFSGVKVYILKDKEYNKNKISIDILKKPLSLKYKLTSVPFIQEYMDSAISKLLSDRLREGIINQNLPITGLSVGKGRFMNIHNMDAFNVTFETLPDMVYSSIAFVNAEIGKMARYGFNGQEFGKSKDIYFRELENIYDNRAKFGNDAYFKRALNNYYNGFSLASIELKFEIMKEILFTISLNQLNQYANAMLGQQDNVVISCRMPEYDGIEGITEERVLSAYNDAGLKTPSIQPDAPVIVWPQFNDYGYVASVSSEVSDPLMEADVIMLSNGATVVLKKTSADTIAFRGVSKGGFSLMDNVNFGNEKYINEVLNLGGLGNFSAPNMERLFSYYNMKMRAGIGENTEKLEGYSDAANLEKLFHAINLSMTARRADESAFDVYKKGKIFETSYRSLSPANTFRDSILYYNYSNKNYVKRVSKEDVEQMRYADILYQTRDRFSNAADFVFIFVGNIDVDLCRDLAAKYIGSIPGNAAQKEDWLVTPNYLTKGNVNKRFLYRMINPRTYSYVTRSYGVKYNIENYVLARLAEAYLKSVLNRRNVKRLVSHSALDVELKYYPEEILTIGTAFETDSLNAANVSDIIDESLNTVAENGIDDAAFTSLIEALKDEFAEKSVTNRYWLNVLEQRYIVGRDFYSNYLKVIDEISADKFRDFITAIVKEGNRISIIMDGTTEDVNTQNLFKEDEFIKDFFEVR